MATKLASADTTREGRRRRLAALLSSKRVEPLAWLLALALWIYVVVYPLFLVRYPPLTDLPFHAANTSILRHYFDASYGFKQQFSVDALSAPYMSFYALGALFALVLPIHVAVKAACAVMLSALPLGLGLLFRGLGKQPLLGVLGLGLVYNTLTHWGFISHVGALGCFAASLGAALMLLEGGSARQQRRRGLLLAGLLLLTLFTHVYRYPFALVSVVALGLVRPGTYPIGDHEAQGRGPRRLARLRQALVAQRHYWLATLPSLLFFAAFWLRRDHVLGAELILTWDWQRLREFGQHVFGGFTASVGQREQSLGLQWLLLAVGLGLGSVAVRAKWFGTAPLDDQPADAGSDAEAEAQADAEAHAADAEPLAAGATNLLNASDLKRLRRRAHGVLVVICVGLLGLYLSLPLTWGGWFFVYPREALSVALLALALLPALPRVPIASLVLAAAMWLGAGRQSYLVAVQWLRFEHLNQDFYAIQAEIPARPKLLYLIFDHTGTYRSTTPFIHLPAWIQAEKGGSLYFHFVRWDLYPIRYRLDSLETPPQLPYFLEWHPEWFRAVEHGAFFDTFLVRHSIDPSVMFRADPTIKLQEHIGNWWLYRRAPAPDQTVDGPPPTPTAPDR